MEEHPPSNKLAYIAVAVLAGFLSVLLSIIESQPTLGQTAIITVGAFLFLSLIFFLLVPTINADFVRRLKTQPRLVVLLILMVLLFPLLNWIYSVELFDAVLSYLIWYIFPTVLMVVPLVIKHPKIKQIDFVFHITAVLVFATGFDVRFTYATVSGFDEMRYQFNALWVSTLILLTLVLQIDDFVSKFNWRVTGKKLAISFLGLSIILLIVLPPGLITGFLSWNPLLDSPEVILIGFIGIWLTIALPEEIIARGVVQHQMTERIFSSESKYRKYWKWIVLIVASILFGSSHWNNTSEEFALVYIILATIAGIVYGICWWFGGLFSAMLIHTLVDWIWGIFLKL